MDIQKANKAAFRAYLEAPIGDAAAIERYIHPDIILPPDIEGGVAGLKRLYDVYATQFEMSSAVTDLVAEDDLVMARVLTRGRHIGEYMGLPGTGRPFEVEEMLIARFVDGKQIEVWRVADRLSLFQQLGGRTEDLTHPA
ncbi:ester cyclase [Sphingosinicella soli]|nr:ester cyclase [Sphingosinicella soli]